MSTFSPTARHAAGFTFPETISRLWTGGVQAWHARKASRAMDELSDATLHDIGITRGEIGYAARYGRPPRA